jgi:hypothetical protein
LFVVTFGMIIIIRVLIIFAGNTSELEQFSLYNYQKPNPAYISPTVDWPDIST